MKRFFLISFLMTMLAGVASAQSFAFTNATAFNSPPNTPPQIDALHFFNLGPFNIGLAGTAPFDFSDVQTFTNRSAMFSTTGFIFDNAPSSSGFRTAADTFGNGNQGVISVGSFTNTFTFGAVFFTGFIGVPELESDLPELNIFATNVVNNGLLSTGMTGIMKVGGYHLDLSKGSMHVEGFDDFNAAGALAGGVSNLITIIGLPIINPIEAGVFNVFQGVGLQTNQLSIFNFLLPSPTSPVNLVTSVGGLLGADIVAPPNATPFVFERQLDESNIIHQVVFINTNLPGIATDVRFQPGRRLSTPVIQWSALVTNAGSISATTNFLYLADTFGSNPTNNLITNGFTLSGVTELAPYNYSFSRSFVGYSNLITSDTLTTNFNAQTIFANAFQATNAYSAYEVSVQPVTFQQDSTAAASSISNLPGRIEITATNWLDLTRAKITGPNYINIVGSNHFVGSANAQIVVPNMDINVGSTNGLLTITNLVAASVPRFTGIIDMWSGRWTNVVMVPVNGTNISVTNSYQVLIVNSGLATSSPVSVLNFAARSTNTLTQTPGNVLISDVLNITNTMLIQSQSLVVTTNDTTSPNGTGQINLANVNIDWAASLPILQNLTNWGVISAPANLDFIGIRQPPYYATSFTEPYKNLVNHGLVITDGITASSDYVESTGFGSVVFQLGTLAFTNNAFGALLYSIDGPISVSAGTALLMNDTILTAAGDVSLTTSNLTAINHSFQSSGSLTLSVTGTLNDGGAASSNFWTAADGINLLAKPAAGDFLGTTVTLTAGASQEVDNMWAGLDLGISAAGFSNNGALGHLILDGGDNLSQFFFSGLDGTTNYALYVDQIELRNGATNRSTQGGTQNFTAFDLAPNFKIYYADAVIGGNDISEKLQQGNNGQLIWVPAFAGIFSGTNFVSSNGKTNFFNRALVQSGDIDSNGNGTANAFDHSPLFTADNVNLAINVANSPTNSATKIATITWAGLANSTNYLYYRSNLLSTNWVQVFSTNQGPVNGTITVKRTNSAGFYRVQVNPSQP